MAPARYPESGGAYRAARLNAVLDGRTVSQERLASAVGTDRRHIIRIENGENRPRPELRDRIAAFLGVDPTTLPAAGEDPFASSEMGALILSPRGSRTKFTDLFKRRLK